MMKPIFMTNGTIRQPCIIIGVESGNWSVMIPYQDHFLKTILS